MCSGSLLRGPANSNLFDARFACLTCFHTCSNPNGQPCWMAASTQKIKPVFPSTYCASRSRHCKCWAIQLSTVYFIGISVILKNVLHYCQKILKQEEKNIHLWSKTETERHTVESSTKIEYIFLNGFCYASFLRPFAMDTCYCHYHRKTELSKLPIY